MSTDSADVEVLTSGTILSKGLKHDFQQRRDTSTRWEPSFLSIHCLNELNQYQRKRRDAVNQTAVCHDVDFHRMFCFQEICIFSDK